MFSITGQLAGKKTHEGRFWKPTPGARGKWRPGTQALREIRHYQKSTELCISKLPFIWYSVLIECITTVIGCRQCRELPFRYTVQCIG